jgi:hypothetical protein
LSDLADSLLPVDDQFLYRYFDANGALLYNGRSNDWTRRLREHWREDCWSGDIMSVRVERYSDLSSVIAAEAASIRAEHPRYNVQHNGPGIFTAELSAGRKWATGEVILMIGLAVVAAYVVYKGTVIAIEKYRCWKAERAEFRAWKQERNDAAGGEPVAAADEPVISPESGPVIVIEPVGVAVEGLVVAASEPRTVITPKQPAPTTPVPEMGPLAALALTLMACKPGQGSGWTSPLWPPVPPIAQ